MSEYYESEHLARFAEDSTGAPEPWANFLIHGLPMHDPVYRVSM